MTNINKKRSKKREIRAAKELGGKTTFGSGCAWYDKADIKDQDHLIEDKFTDKDYYSIKHSVLKKIEKEAVTVKKIAVFRFGFEKFKHDYVLLNKYYLKNVSIADTIEKLMVSPGKKSVRVFDSDLHKKYIETNSLFFLNIEYCINNIRYNYLLMTWENFIKNKSLFLC